MFANAGSTPTAQMFRATLVLKSANAANPGQYRPISVGLIMRRLFTDLLAVRLNKNSIGRCQRGFHAVGLPQPPRELIGNMYRGNNTRLGMDPKQWIIILKRGVLQGEPISPTLFNFVVYEVVDNLNGNRDATL